MVFSNLHCHTLVLEGCLVRTVGVLNLGDGEVVVYLMCNLITRQFVQPISN